MVNIQEKLKIDNLVRRHNPDNIVPRLVLCSSNGEILCDNELD